MIRIRPFLLLVYVCRFDNHFVDCVCCLVEQNRRRSMCFCKLSLVRGL